jgi:hypothetical protein
VKRNTEVNEVKNRNEIRKKINEIKSWFIGKINKIDKSW